MTYDVTTSDQCRPGGLLRRTIRAVSPQDAALKAATKLSSCGCIRRGRAADFEVSERDDPRAITTVTVTPLGRTWGSIVNRYGTVAA